MAGFSAIKSRIKQPLESSFYALHQSPCRVPHDYLLNQLPQHIQTKCSSSPSPPLSSSHHPPWRHAVNMPHALRTRASTAETTTVSSAAILPIPSVLKYLLRLKRKLAVSHNRTVWNGFTCAFSVSNTAPCRQRTPLRLISTRSRPSCAFVLSNPHLRSSFKASSM